MSVCRLMMVPMLVALLIGTTAGCGGDDLSTRSNSTAVPAPPLISAIDYEF